MTHTKGTREAWLQAMLRGLRAHFTAIGHPLPDKIRISCGWPSSRAIPGPTAKSRTIGECWQPAASADGTTEIFVSPCIGEATAAGAILVHELCHATGARGHKAEFRSVATAAGLIGKMTATSAGADLEERLNDLIQKHGPYPHATLDQTLSGKKKQSTRMLKLECPACGYTVRTTAKWIEAGLPTCPCGEEMQPEDQQEEEE